MLLTLKAATAIPVFQPAQYTLPAVPPPFPHSILLTLRAAAAIPVFHPVQYTWPAVPPPFHHPDIAAGPGPTRAEKTQRVSKWKATAVIYITTDEINEKHFAYDEGRLQGIPGRKG